MLESRKHAELCICRKSTDTLQAFLLFEGSSHEEWLRRTIDSRSAYSSVRSHLLRGLEHPEELGSGVDPLSEEVEVSRFLSDSQPSQNPSDFS